MEVQTEQSKITTKWGIVFAVINVIAAAPQLVDFLPDEVRKIVIGIVMLLNAAIIYMGFSAARDANPQTKIISPGVDLNIRAAGPSQTDTDIKK